MAQLCLWTKIRTKQWLILGASALPCVIAAPRWPKDISSAADNAIFKNSVQKHPVETRNNFCEQKFAQHGPITIAIDCNGLSLIIFEEIWPNYASESKFAPNSNWFWMRQLFNVCVRVFCAPNATILLVYIPAKIKLSFVWKDNFFLPKSTSCVSQSRARCSSVYTHIRSAQG